MRRRVFLIALPVLGAVCLTSFLGCGNGTPVWEQNKPHILTSIVPLHCFTAAIAGEDADVRCLLIGNGPHDFQPSAHDARLLSGADLFIVNGLGLEEFLDGLVRNAGNRKMKIIKTGDRIPAGMLKKADGTPHYHGDKLVSHKGTDPHVWLGVPQAIHQIDAIRDALCDLDPVHAAGYRTRAAALVKRLEKLQADNQNIPNLGGGLVSFHNSFQYFGDSYKIPIAGSIRGLRGEQIGEAELVQQANEFRKKDVRLIGVEPQYPRQVADNLAKSIGKQVKVIDLDPIETGREDPNREFYVDPEWYFTRMQKNLDNVRMGAAPIQP